MHMPTSQQLTTTQLTRCPHCGALAEIERRCVLESSDGPVEHAKVRCVLDHNFLLPTASLARVVAAASRVDAPDLTAR
jgi:hypothetical protein